MQHPFVRYWDNEGWDWPMLQRPLIWQAKLWAAPPADAQCYSLHGAQDLAGICLIRKIDNSFWGSCWRRVNNPKQIEIKVVYVFEVRNVRYWIDNPPKMMKAIVAQTSQQLKTIRNGILVSHILVGRSYIWLSSVSVVNESKFAEFNMSKSCYPRSRKSFQPWAHAVIDSLQKYQPQLHHCWHLARIYSSA